MTIYPVRFYSKMGLMPERFEYSDQAETEAPQHKCGIVALYTDEPTEQFPYLLRAAGGVQHRGQQGAGVALYTPDGLMTHTGDGLLARVFTADVRSQFENVHTNIGLLHCRYGTFGGYDERNLQPTVVLTPEGQEISVIHNGQFTGIEQMRATVDPTLPQDVSDTYLFARKLAESPGETMDEKVLTALADINGAYNLAIGTPDGLYVARDEFGLHPFVLGKVRTGESDGIIAASETFALRKVGAEVLREVKRGEVSRIDRDGITVLRTGLSGEGNTCIFEGDYFSHPVSKNPTYDRPDDGDHPERWRSVLRFRERCGELAAERIEIPNASFIVGIPDSGVPFASGYANALGIPRRDLILRDHYDTNGNGTQRTFQFDNDIRGITKKVDNKLLFDEDIDAWNDAVVILADDSIVRGSVSRTITEKIFSYGAREVHWISGFMEVRFPCHLGVSMRTPEELLAARYGGDLEKMAEEIGATSINFISSEDYLRAYSETKPLVIPRDPLDIFLANDKCGGCITGRYPIDREGTVYSHK